MPEGQHEPVYQPMQVVPNQKWQHRVARQWIMYQVQLTVPEAEQFPNLDLNIKGVK